MGPLGGGERDEEHGAQSDRDEPPDRCARNAIGVLTAKQAEQDDDQAEDHHQDAVAPREGAVRGGQHEVVVAHRLLPPLQGRPHIGGNLIADEQRHQWLIGEDLEQHGGTRGQDRREHREQSVAASSGDQGLDDGTDAGEQRRHGHQSAGCERQGECGDDDGDGVGQQSSGCDGTLDATPREQGADGLGRLRTQTVVVRQPDREEDEGGRPDGGRRVAHLTSQTRDDLTADEPPAEQTQQERREPHPRRGEADLGHRRDHMEMPAERILGDAEIPEVVVRVARGAGDAADDEVVPVVGGVCPGDPPERQDHEHDDVRPADRPPSGRENPLVAAAISTIQDGQCDERRDGHQDADDDRGELHRTGRAHVPGVDGRVQAQSVTRSGCGQVAVDADDLRTHLLIGDGEGVLPLAGQSGEARGHLGAVGVEQDAAVRIVLCRSSIRVEDDDVAVGDGEGVLGCPDEESARGRVLTARRDRRHQDAAGGGKLTPQRARHRQVHVDGDIGDQRSGHVGDGVVLRPTQFRGGLIHREQRRGEGEQEAEQSGHHRDDLDRPVIASCVTHLIAAPP